MLENRHLRYFIEVARSLHVRRAAERLHIAQPALTQNIQQLESELGVELFHRESRHLRLTEAGQIFLVEAEQSLRQSPMPESYALFRGWGRRIVIEIASPR